VKLLAILGGLAVILAVTLGLFLTRGGGAADFRGSRPPDGLTLPSFQLRDQDGREVSSQGLRGKAVAVTFLDSECTEACPIIAAQMGQAVRTLGGGNVEAVAITVDPGRDTPQRIETFLRRFHARTELRYLDGPPAELRPVWKAFAVLPAVDSGSSNIHSAPVRIYDTEGRWRSTLNSGADLTTANLAHDLREASAS
jgi:cytochrome oxidase Cu insertion factor (SCO1/SenC/PrrC family)